ncbi:MAG: NUDIX hydrolase [Patescibacteria group bacterium]|nr:NUDIX hydrolase [Patescibacteria group bacterium]
MEKNQKKENSKAVCLVALRANKVLLIQKQNVWILPGGIQTAEESDLECLTRNLSEQLPCVRAGKSKFFGGFFGQSAFGDHSLEAVTYYAEISGEILPGENLSARWFDYEELKKTALSKITQKVVNSLRKEKRL